MGWWDKRRTEFDLACALMLLYHLWSSATGYSVWYHCNKLSEVRWSDKGLSIILFSSVHSSLRSSSTIRLFDVQGGRIRNRPAHTMERDGEALDDWSPFWGGGEKWEVLPIEGNRSEWPLWGYLLNWGLRDQYRPTGDAEWLREDSCEKYFRFR